MKKSINTEKAISTLPGLLMLPVFLFAAGAFLRFGVLALNAQTPVSGILFLLSGFVCLFCLGGLFVVNPNEARVLQLFGDYVGTVKEDGLRWANPFYTKRSIMLRIRNFESAKIKVNDHDGNPIEIGAVVVWKVVDTAEACFEVDDYEHYVTVQTEAAIRTLANHYPYDTHIEGEFSLRGSTAEVATRLKAEIQERLDKAGVQVIEARISHLAYAQEIAAAMLRRQQAGAIIAARQRIVEGAVGMVEMALDLLQKSGKVNLDEERKAAMVSNLLVVLCGDREAQPVVNTGSIY
ncbi:MAG: SPFH domain-containing protein [Vicinamibacteria bacterium]|nr:SPFH domain-containing protein [Vicinamibacteria bacterium]